MSKRKATGAKGNFVSEWFGHRVYPSVSGGKTALSDQNTARCPFLSDALGRTHECVKPEASRGVCTISSTSNGPRQDWLVCPHRALVPSLLDDVVIRLFGAGRHGPPTVVPGPALEHGAVRARVEAAVDEGRTVAVYLQEKLGGEISVARTERSPEISFDITLAQLARSGSSLKVERYGILEVQTMDFHGSYRAAVRNLTDAARLHKRDFQETLGERTDWLSEGIEGPNIANVFKRTFYQMIFKFRLAANPSCAGSALAIPTAVWDSWQRHLGRPELVARGDGTHELRAPGAGGRAEGSRRGTAWIYVFEPDAASRSSPNPIRIDRILATDADAVAHFALKVAPEAAVGEGGAAESLLGQVRSRLANWWPDLATG